jgi:hypothetical protein
MIFTGRRIGVFLFVMAGLALIDWGLAAVAFRGPPAIVGLILYGELYGHSHPPLPYGLMRLPCPGNGFASFCGPWALSLMFLFTLAVGIGLYVNVMRTLALGFVQGRVGPLDRRRLFVNLSIVASVLLAIGFVWGWVQYFGISERLPWVTPIYQVVAPFIHLLFILASLAAGRHLRRSRQTV